MIHVNLLGERVDTDSAHIIQILIFGASMLATVVLCFGVQIYFSGQLSSAQDEKQQLEVRLNQLKKITREVAELEKNKKVLREKLTTIATLMAKQHGPVRILDDLNTSIPEKTWLTAVKEKSGELVVNGVALDNETVALFMHDLEKSDYFNAVDLNHTTRDRVKGAVLKKFSLTIKLEDLLKLKREKDKNGAKKEDELDMVKMVEEAEVEPAATAKVEPEEPVEDIAPEEPTVETNEESETNETAEEATDEETPEV